LKGERLAGRSRKWVSPVRLASSGSRPTRLPALAEAVAGSGVLDLVEVDLGPTFGHRPPIISYFPADLETRVATDLIPPALLPHPFT